MALSPPCYEWLRDCISGPRGGRHFCSTATQWAVGSGTGDTEARGSPATGPMGPRPCTFGCLLPEGASPTVLTPQLRGGTKHPPPSWLPGRMRPPSKGSLKWDAGGKPTESERGQRPHWSGAARGYPVLGGCGAAGSAPAPARKRPWRWRELPGAPTASPGRVASPTLPTSSWDGTLPPPGQDRPRGPSVGMLPVSVPPPAAPFRPRFAPRPAQAAARELAHAADSCGVAARPARRGCDSAPGGHPASCGVRGGSPGFCAPPDRCSPLAALRHLRFRGVRLLQRRDRGDGEVQR